MQARSDYPRIQFISSNQLPSLIWKAAKKTGRLSSTEYLQDIICAQVAKDLGLNVEDLKAALPPRRRQNASPAYWDNKHRSE